MAGCADCHTNRTAGKLIRKAPFAGGMVVQMNCGMLHSANITPDVETGIGRWNRQEFLDRFRAYDPSTHSAPNVQGGFNTIMPWTLYAGMTDADLTAIFEYMKTVRHKVEVFTLNRQRR